MKQLEKELARAKWYDEETVSLGLHSHNGLGLDRAEVITCLCSLIHGPLHKSNPAAYARFVMDDDNDKYDEHDGDDDYSDDDDGVSTMMMTSFAIHIDDMCVHVCMCLQHQVHHSGD